MNAIRFRREVSKSLEAAKGTYIYDACMRDLSEKTAPEDPCGYRAWLRRAVEHCRTRFGLQGARILDLGCGSGEMTVMLNLLGYQAIGVDVDDRVLGLARILAEDNGIPPDRFRKAEGMALPFEDGSFDLVMMISSLEHMDGRTLAWLVPEMSRVCRGVVFVQVPSAMKTSDDHTGLKLVPWMPPWLAARYIAARGKRYRYLISGSGKWDVVYRNLRQIERSFEPHFELHLVPADCSYPPCRPEDAVLDLRRTIRLGSRSFVLRIPLLHRWARRVLGAPIESFYPYYNLAFRRR